jgi:DNA-binding NtrC family response regulator
MHTVAIANARRAKAFSTDQDQEMASRSGARLLITASADGEAEVLARRIHGASERAGSPFVRARACDLPIEPQMLKDACASLLDTAAGGSILIHDVEQTPPTVQRILVDVFAELEFARASSPSARLMTATRVSLLDRIAAGTFSDRLFYRLNMIHLVVAAGDS